MTKSPKQPAYVCCEVSRFYLARPTREKRNIDLIRSSSTATSYKYILPRLIN